MAKDQKVSLLTQPWAKQHLEPHAAPVKRGLASVHTRFTFSALHELWNVAGVLAFWLAAMATFVAFNVWMWMPHAVR